MAKSKSFNAEALATLTGSAPQLKPAMKVAVTPVKKKQTKDVKVLAEKAKVDVAQDVKDTEKRVVVAQQEQTIAAKTVKKVSKAKKESDLGIQDPNKRSVKVKNAPVTYYLNTTNMQKLKEYAEKTDQKPSWILDELIYDFLLENAG